MRRGALWLAVGGVTFGLASELVGFEIDEPGRWIPDLVTGWVLIGCGLVAWDRRSESATGPLLAVTGFAWFLGNFAAVGGFVGWVGRQGLYLHRGPLFHAVIAYPRGRPSSPIARGAVVLFYGVSVVPAIWSNEASTIVLAVLFLAVTALGYARSVGPDRRAGLVSLEACAGLSAVIVASTVTRLTVPNPDVGTVALLAYEVTLCAAAAWLTAGLIAAPRLAVSNARLQSQVQSRVRELEASRRRLLHASDDERRALERVIHDGAERRLREVGDALRQSRTSSSGETTQRVGDAEAQLEGTLEDLRRLARGLHPGVLADRGLASALEGLSETFSLPLRVEVPARRLGPELELVAYFMCSEALANISKHARASSAAVSVTVVDERMVILVEDDGVGGADPAAGSGLRGLADRIETIGGRLQVRSVPGGGTRLAAEIPLGGEAV